jgi:transcriptional regulator with XRE-family HTH domain
MGKNDITGILLPVIDASPPRIGASIADRLRARRLQVGWSRETLASRSGVNLWSLKRFEVTGRIALESLVKMAIALGNGRDFESLFSERRKQPATMEELEKLNPPPRVRGRTLR